jgi:hypothetical protein
LNRGRAAAWEGRSEDALRDFMWFHEHALDYDRALYGVRLSFALGYWTDLAETYAPARDALDAMAKRGEAALLSGRGDRNLFREVASINENLGRVRHTYELFRRLLKAKPALARDCRDLAVEAIVEAKDFKLASKQLPHPEEFLLWLSERLNDDLTRKGVSRKTAIRRREAYVHNYCRDVRTALKILRGLGNFQAAEATREWAIALVAPRQARSMVALTLAKDDA